MSGLITAAAVLINTTHAAVPWKGRRGIPADSAKRKKKKEHQTSYKVSFRTSYSVKLTVLVVMKWTRIKCRTLISGDGSSL